MRTKILTYYQVFLNSCHDITLFFNARKGRAHTRALVVSIGDFTPQTDGTVEFTYSPIKSPVLEGFRDVDQDGTQVIVCIGGGASSQHFPEAASTAERRERFVETTFESVTSILIRTKSGEAADSRTSSASSSSASRRHNLRNRREHGEYEVSLTVTTANGKFTFSLRKLALKNQIRRDC